MFDRLNIRQRILAAILLLILAGSAIQTLIAGSQLQAATLEFFQHHLETEALLIAASLSEPLEQYLEGEDVRDLGRALTNLQRKADYTYLIVDSRLQIISFTPQSGYETQQSVPNSDLFSMASRNGIGARIDTDSANVDRLQVAVPILYEDTPLGYLILMRPMQDAYAEVARRWLILIGTLLPAIAIGLVVSMRLARTISKPVQDLHDSALLIAKGKLDTRIHMKVDDEVGQLAQAFNYMAEQLQDLLQSQRNFISHAAHELRTPLMTLKLRLEALEDPALPDTTRMQYLYELQDEVQNMSELVSSLLMLARIDEDHHASENAVGDPMAVLRDSARQLRIEAEQHALAVDVHIPDTLPELALPAQDLRLVLSNLIANAIKYTPKGWVRLDVRCSADHVCISVQDSGIGFRPEESSRLFQRFYRTAEARSTVEGHGLGLSIVQAVLARSGATIRATSDGPGRGAIFTVTIPTAVKTAPAPA